MTEKTLSIGIIGGGLGGLATTIALTRAGFDVEVFERAAALGEVGAGINISPQATRALLALGLGDRLEKTANRVTGQIQRSMYTGEQLAETTMVKENDLEGRFGSPYYVLHRADLLGVLADAVASDRIHLNHHCTGLEEEPDGVTVTFANGAARTFDLVIGADGIKSQVRNYLYGEESAEFTGQMVWRAQLDGKAFSPDILGPHGFCGWIGQGRHIMSYYLRGADVINITTQSDAEAWVEEGWSIYGDPAEMRSGFPDATPQLQELLDSITECSKWGLFGRKPSEKWGRGRIQLIGDAAHPMLPNAGQGAAQAFEDAYVLGRWLQANKHDYETAFAGFRNVRIPRAHAIQRQSLLNSKLVHAGDWEERQATFRKRESEGDTPLGLGWIYDYDPVKEWANRIEYPLSFELAASPTL
ncbi:FAD-dependent monooxygenase [Paenarthrobacter sp. YAF11_1]|uniref:FAD-dependent monooxygenase n=1 Tax=Paenarthrobacter sp. YAF11_1 TaxID=3233074 RepID=UPI003F943B33